MARVAVSHEVLQWAIERSGRQGDIEARFPIDEWLTGVKLPTLRQLEQFARAAHTPLGFLFLPRPPQDRMPIPNFRTVADEPFRPSPDLLDTLHGMKRRQDWMRDRLIDEGVERLPFIGCANVRDDVTPIAEQIRRALSLEQGWASRERTWSDALRRLQNAIEKSGILLVVNGVVGNNNHRRLDPGEFRGFVLVDDHAPLLFVNGADGKAAQMFTLAHELAHLWFGSSAAFDLRNMQPANNDTEKACNALAAEFLVPEDELRTIWQRIAREPDFQAVARHFKVSEIVAARRALDLGLMTWDGFLAFYNAYQEGERLRPSPEGGDFYNNQNLRVGRRFAHAVFHAVKEGALLYREAYQLTGLHGRAFDEYISRIDLGRAG